MVGNTYFSYYDYIMGDTDTSVKNTFHKEWLAFLDSLDVPYSNALQLRIGSHLRPLLVYWGYMLGKGQETVQNLKQVTELALCVEILHKVSIIVDDLIDKDIRRHNATTFHIQFSSDETIIFAVYMLGIAFEKLNAAAPETLNLQKDFIKLYAETLHTMAKGCLQELTLSAEKRYHYEKIVDIISQETSTLIKNSMVMGYASTLPTDNTTIDLITDIGDKVGYLFQVMNDLEPFASDSSLAVHKGTLNLDFDRSRKNIVLPYIYGACNVQEKEKLISLSGQNTEYVLKLYAKYHIEELIKNDLSAVEHQIENCFTLLSRQQINQECLKDFIRFYKDIIKIGKSRLRQVSQEPID